MTIETLNTIEIPEGQTARVLSDAQVIAFYERHWQPFEDRKHEEQLAWLDEIDADMNDIDAMVNSHVAMSLIVAKLTQALEFYAVQANWQEPRDNNLRVGDVLSNVAMDNGLMARMALGWEATR